MIFKLNRLLTILSKHTSALYNKQLNKMSTCSKLVGEPSDIVWMDLEMTGLNVDKDVILEVSCIITDKLLNIKSEGPCFAIKHPEHVYETMNEWSLKHHNQSGLVDRCRSSDVTPDQAENLILTYLKANIPNRKCPLAGNSVYVDRLFINKYFPLVNEYLHYRIIDVSTIKELATRWNPQIIAGAPRKQLSHRSLADIKESIQELKYYKEHLFK